jgi:putative transposase
MIIDGLMRVNQFGQIIFQTCEWLPKQYPYIKLDIYTIMPNYFHEIIEIIKPNNPGRCGSRPAPTKNTKIKPLGQLIGAFKTNSANQINQFRMTPGSSVWHGDFYDPIIRNESELDKITDYTLANPLNWMDDPENLL